MAQLSVRRGRKNQECRERFKRAETMWTRPANSIEASGVRTAASVGRTHGSTSTTRPPPQNLLASAGASTHATFRSAAEGFLGYLGPD